MKKLTFGNYEVLLLISRPTVIKLTHCISILFFFSGCASDVSPQETAIENSLWIPSGIRWERPLPNDPELSSIQYASFDVLAFKSHGKYMRLRSTHSLGTSDTIFLATEPGFSLDSGSYVVENSRVIIACKNTRNVMVPWPSTYKGITIDTLSFVGNSLLYDSIHYNRHNKFAGNSIESFWSYLSTK